MGQDFKVWRLNVKNCGILQFGKVKAKAKASPFRNAQSRSTPLQQDGAQSCRAFPWQTGLVYSHPGKCGNHNARLKFTHGPSCVPHPLQPSERSCTQCLHPFRSPRHGSASSLDHVITPFQHTSKCEKSWQSVTTKENRASLHFQPPVFALYLNFADVLDY